MLLSVWEIWERFFSELNHIQKIRPDGLFRLSVHPYHGPALELNDGTPIRPGDLVGEIHLSSRDALQLQLKYNSRIKVAIAARKALTQDLACLAEWVTSEQNMAEVKALFAITMLYHGARVLGFEDREVKNWAIRRLYTLGEGLLLIIYHPAGIFRLRQGRQDLTIRYIWMSRQKLLHDFLPAAEK
jgi:antitoxin component of MazEF toxin-antitoxin module